MSVSAATGLIKARTGHGRGKAGKRERAVRSGVKYSTTVWKSKQLDAKRIVNIAHDKKITYTVTGKMTLLTMHTLTGKVAHHGDTRDQ